MPKILVIDDELPMTQLLTIALNRKGFDIVTALSGYDGLLVASGESLDAVILDLVLPDMSGQEVLRHLRQAPCLRALPVLVLTALDARTEEAAVRAAGADAFVTKPVDFASLAIQLHDLISTANNRRERLVPFLRAKEVGKQLPVAGLCGGCSIVVCLYCSTQPSKSEYVPIHQLSAHKEAKIGL